MNVYQKMHAVMQNVQYLSKDGNIEYGKNTKYKAISEEKVTTAVRTAMVEVGLVIFPVSQSRERVGQITSVDVQYRIQNIDDPDDYVLVVSSGDGADTQDKGAGKAMTYAFKYALLRAFAIPTGEDPDKVSSAELDEEQRKREEEQRKQAEEQEAAFVAEQLEKCKNYSKKLLLKLHAGDTEAAKKEFEELEQGKMFVDIKHATQCMEVLKGRLEQANAQS